MGTYKKSCLRPEGIESQEKDFIIIYSITTPYICMVLQVKYRSTEYYGLQPKQQKDRHEHKSELLIVYRLDQNTKLFIFMFSKSSVTFEFCNCKKFWITFLTIRAMLRQKFKSTWTEHSAYYKLYKSQLPVLPNK